MHPPQIEPYQTLQSLALHPDLASFAVRDRKTGAPATLWLADEALILPPTAPHAHLLDVYAHGMRDGYEYIVTEPVHETLQTLLQREGALSSERAIAVAVGVARGLSQLLMAGLCVGPVTTADVAVGPDGTPKVIPFSLSLEKGPSDDAGLLSSLGGLYCEMLTGRRPRPDDPLAAASTEILRGLVTSSLARERVGKLPNPAPPPGWLPATQMGTHLPSLTTIFRWSGAAVAVAVVAIVLGVRASMPPVTATPPRAAPAATQPTPEARLPQITERLRVPQHRRARRRVPVKETPALAARAPRRHPVTMAAAAPAPSRALVTPVTHGLVPARTALPRAPRPVPPQTTTPVRATPRAVVAHARELPASLRPLRSAEVSAGPRRRPVPSPQTAIALPSTPVPPRERVLGEPPTVFRDDPPRARRARTTAADTRVASVRLKVVLDPEGRPETALVVRSSGDPRTDQAAVRAAREMHFDPPRNREGERSAGHGGVTYATVAVPNVDFPGRARPVAEFP